MPKEIRKLYELLIRELGWIHYKWEVYRQLFGSSAERIDLLNRIAPYFFGVCQGVLFSDIVLGLCRLTDSPKVGSRKRAKETLCFERLLCAIDHRRYPELRKKAQSHYKKVMGNIKSLRESRNCLIAHNDLAILQNDRGGKCFGVSRQLINDTLANMDRFMSSILSHFEHLDWVPLLDVSAGEILIEHLDTLRKLYDKYGIDAVMRQVMTFDEPKNVPLL